SQAAARELKTRFVGRGRADRGDFAERNRLIAIGERRATADGVQASDAARIQTVNVIEAVARRQQIARIDAVIGARQKIGRVVPPGGEPGADARPGKFDLVKRVVDGRYVRGRDG